MATERSASDHHEDLHHAYMENILPASISKLERSLPSTPKMERSITSGFFSDHHHTRPQSPRSEVDLDEACIASSSQKNDMLTPISNWAQLTFMKNQRNTLRSKLKAQQVASNEARASVTTLRRLAIRLAVNIAVKEKQIASAAKSLANSRKTDYAATRNAEKQIEQLRESLKDEERRNKEILMTLERASNMAFEYANLGKQSHGRLQSNSMMTPPSSPAISQDAIDWQVSTRPRTLFRGPASAALRNSDNDFTLNSNAPHQRNTSNDDLIRVKRESERALAACRQRIEALQSECLRRKENASLLEGTQTILEADIQVYQSRIASLEKSRRALEEQLHEAQSQIGNSLQSDAKLRHLLGAKSQEILQLNEQVMQNQVLLQDAQSQLRSSVQSTAELQQQLVSRKDKIVHLKEQVSSMTQQLCTSQKQHDSSARSEARVREELESKKNAIAELEAQVEFICRQLESSSCSEAQLRQQFQLGTREKSDLEERLQMAQSALGQATSSEAALQQQLESKSQKISELEQHVCSIRVQLEASTQVEAELRQRFDARKKEMDELEEQLSLTQSQFGQYTNSLTESRNQLASKGQKILQLEDQLCSIRSQLKDSQRSEVSLKEQIKSKSQEVFQLEDQLGQTQSHLVNSIQSESEFKDQLKLTSQTIRKLQDASRQRQSDLVALKEAKRQLEQDVSRHTARIKELETHTARTEKELRTIKDKLDVVEAREMEMRSGISKSEEERRNLKALLDQSQAYVESSEQAAAFSQDQVQQYTKENQSLHDNVLLLRNSLNASEKLKESARDDLAIARVSLADLEMRLRSADDKSTTFQTKLESAAQARKDLEKESGNMLEQFKRETDRKAELEAELNTLRSAHEQLKEELTASNDRIRTVERQSASYLEALESMNSAKAELENQLDNLQRVSAELRDEVQSHIDHLKASKAKMAEIHKELKRSKESTAESEQKLEEAQRSNSALQSEVQYVRVQRNESDKTASDLREQLDRLECHKAKMVIDLQHVTAQLQDSETAKDNLRSKLERIRRSKSALEMRFDTATREFQELTGSQNDLHDELHQMQRSKVELQADLHTTKDQLASLESTTVEIRTEIEMSEVKNAQLKEEIRRLITSKERTGERLEESQRANSDISWRLEKEAIAHKDQVSSFEKAVTDIQKELWKSEGSMSELHAHHCQLIDTKREVEERLNDLHASNKELSEQSKAAAKTYAVKIASLEQSKTELEGKMKVSEQSVTDLHEELSRQQRSKAEVQERLSSALTASAEMESKFQQNVRLHEDQIVVMQKAIDNLREKMISSEQATTVLREELDQLMHTKNQVEGRLDSALDSNTTLEESLSIIKARLLQAENENSTWQAKLADAHKENDTLRCTNIDLEKSEDNLSTRLATAEEELRVVKQTNERLSAFIEKIEHDMAKAEAATVVSEYRLEGFVNKSDIKLKATQSSEERYKHQSLAQAEEVESLALENAGLRDNIKQQERVVEALKTNSGQAQAELKKQGKLIQDVQRSRSDFMASLLEIENDVKTLREDKREFEDVIKRLHENTQQLEASAKWNRSRAAEREESERWNSMRSNQEDRRDVPSTPILQRATTQDSSIHNDHAANFFPSPVSVQSPTSRSEAFEAWTSEVERIRMLHEETVVQLNGMKNTEKELRTTLKEREAQLHQLEKQSPMKRQRTLLHKRNSPAQFTPSPSRPFTAVVPPSTSTPLQTTFDTSDDGHPRPWSSLPRPNTSPRPHSSWGRLVPHRLITRESQGTKSTAGSLGKERDSRRTTVRKTIKGLFMRDSAWLR